MANTYVLIASNTLASASASVTFSAIPQTYTDLVVKCSTRSDQSGVNRSFKVQPNGVDITAKRLGTEGNPQSPYSDSGISIYTPGSGATASTFGNAEIYISNYASTTTYKALSIDAVEENNGVDDGLSLTAGLYSSNSAITSITIPISLGNFVQYSSFYLYGIKNS
jgi:hypothetical protein